MRLSLIAVAAAALCVQLISSSPNSSLVSRDSSNESSLSLVSAAPLVPITIDGTILRQGTARWYPIGSGYDHAVDNTNYAIWKPSLDKLRNDVPGLNAIRVYVINPDNSYTQFLNYTESTGLYVIVGATPSNSYKSGACNLNRENPPSEVGQLGCYPACLLTFGQQVMSIFSVHTNVLAFTVGNEVMDGVATWKAAPCLKRYIGDLKAWQSGCSSSSQMRKVPLIYSDANNAITVGGQLVTEYDLHAVRMRYLTCGAEEFRVDAYGINFFSFCRNDLTFALSFQNLHNSLMSVWGTAGPASRTTVPTIFTEYGCGFFYSADQGVRVPRTFKQTPIIYGSQMSDIFSGGFAYTYSTRGGQEFGFYTGGSNTDLENGVPGLTKNCSSPSLAADGVTVEQVSRCAIDNYAAAVQVAKALPPSQTAPSATAFSGLAPEGKTCNETFYGIYDLRYLTVPSRQDTDGYTLVECPAAPAGTSTSSSTATTSAVDGGAGDSSSTASVGGDGGAGDGGAGGSTAQGTPAATSASAPFIAHQQAAMLVASTLIAALIAVHLN